MNPSGIPVTHPCSITSTTKNHAITGTSATNTSTQKTQTKTVMKTYLPYSLILAAAASGMAFGAETAYTTPVGYYNFAAKGGGNLFIPGLVNSAAYAGVLTGASSTTLTVAANSLPLNAYNQGAVFATHYAEITSGPNAGVALDIASNTTSIITLIDNIASLSLTGTEKITIRQHVTLKSSLASAESSLNVFSDSATFYLTNGNSISYTYGGDGGTGWSSDFSTPDGNLRPVAPGTGFVLGVAADVSLNVVGTVKPSPTVVMLGAGVVNIVGPVNPLVGTSVSLNTVGFGTLAPFSDSITVYVPGPLAVSTSYSPLGDPGLNLSSDFATPTTDTMANTTGAVVIPAIPSSVKINQGFTVAP